MKKDIFTYILNNNSRDLGSFSNPIFNINYLQKKNNYVKITCYVDQFEAMLLTLSDITNLMYLETNLNQINSYNSTTKGTSNILCVINRTIQESSSSGYQNSNASYQGPQTPIELGSLPDNISLKLVKANGNVVDMDTGNNPFTVKLRFECEYETGCGCGC